MDQNTLKVMDNVKFLLKADKDHYVKVDDLWQMCQEDHISSLTLNRVLITLEEMHEIFFIKSGVFVFIDCTEVNVDEKISG